MVVNKTTGEVARSYSSAEELDGTTYVNCGNRRAQACPTCSAEYKGDAWHLLLCGLAGGKGIPGSVSDHPCTFATFTAPSFGAVHGLRQKGPCRARRDKPVCPHGRPLWCSQRHRDDDDALGSPLCADCYDYTAHVVWQWHAPELWRRFTITLQRDLARFCGLSVKRFRERVRISYSKVVEFQARGVIHLHVPIRLDGPDGPDGPAPDPALGLDTAVLEDTIKTAAAKVYLDSAPLSDGTVHRLHWGNQLDTRSITDTAHRDTDRRATSGAPRTGRRLPGEVPDQGHRGVRAPFPDPVRPARPTGRRHHARRPDHRDRRTDRRRERRLLPARRLPRHPRLSRAPDHQVPRLLRHLRTDPPIPPPVPQQPCRPWTQRRTSARFSTPTTTSPTGSSSSPHGSSSARATSTSTRPPLLSRPPRSRARAECRVCQHRNSQTTKGLSEMQRTSRDLGRPPALYRIDDAAALLSVSKSRVYELIRSGQLGSVTVGKSRRVPAVAVDAYVARLMRGGDHDDAA